MNCTILQGGSDSDDEASPLPGDMAAMKIADDDEDFPEFQAPTELPIEKHKIAILRHIKENRVTCLKVNLLFIMTPWTLFIFPASLV